MTPTDVTLDDLRRQIDQIDDSIHDLLMRRADLSVQVRAAKGAAAPLFRPSREADLIRRLVRRHRGATPVSALVRVWREIISASLSIQGRLGVAVCAPDNQPGYGDMARDHFGTIIPITTYQAPGAVVRAVTDDATAIGVLPWPSDNDPDPWWRYLVSSDGKAPRIVGRLPFLGRGQGLDALVIARVPVDATADDRAFIVVETSIEMSRTRLLSRLAGAGCEVGFIATYQEGAQQPARMHLVELAGYVQPGDAKLAGIAEAVSGDAGRVVWLGGYAVPLAEAEPTQGD